MLACCVAEKMLQLERALQLFHALEAHGPADGLTMDHGEFDPRRSLCVVFVSGDIAPARARIAELRDTVLAELRRTRKDTRYEDVLLTKTNFLLVYSPNRSAFDEIATLKKALHAGRPGLETRSLSERSVAVDSPWTELLRERMKQDRRDTVAYVLVCVLTVLAALWQGATTPPDASCRHVDQQLVDELCAEVNARIDSVFAQHHEAIHASFMDLKRTMDAALVEIHESIVVNSAELHGNIGAVGQEVEEVATCPKPKLRA